MKMMTNRQLGGADDTEFYGETFEEVAKQCSEYCRKKIAEGDIPHIKAMKEMQELMKNPEDVQTWMAERKAAFDALPHV